MDLQTKYDTLGLMLKHTWEDTLPDKETATAMGECLVDIGVDEKRVNSVGNQLMWYQARVAELTGELKQCLAGSPSDNAQKAVEKAEAGVP